LDEESSEPGFETELENRRAEILKDVVENDVEGQECPGMLMNEPDTGLRGIRRSLEEPRTQWMNRRHSLRIGEFRVVDPGITMKVQRINK
jgi:hypothetical protein